MFSIHTLLIKGDKSSYASKIDVFYYLQHSWGSFVSSVSDSFIFCKSITVESLIFVDSLKLTCSWEHNFVYANIPTEEN